MRKGFKLKKKKNRPTNMQIHQAHCQTARFCQGINLQDLKPFSETNFKDFSRTFPGLKLNLTNLFIPEISKS